MSQFPHSASFIDLYPNLETPFLGSMEDDSLPAQRVLQQAGQLGVAERDENEALPPAFPQCIDAVCQRQQRPVIYHINNIYINWR